MIVLLEGCDGAGKTTAAEMLAKEGKRRGYHVEILHRGAPTRHPLEEYELDLEVGYPRHPDDRAQTLWIMDRWHHGQKIYGGLYEDADILGPGGAWHVDALLQSRGAVQYILSPSVDTLRSRLKSRGEDYLQDRDIEHVHDEYEKIAEQFSNSVSLVTLPVTDAAVREMIDAAERRSDTAEYLAAYTSYVGPPDPDVLLLVSHARDIRYHAAYVPYEGTSGRVLCDTIALTPGLSQQRIAMANIMHDSPLNLLARTKSNPVVIALGDEVQQRLIDMGIPHGHAPYPFYMQKHFPSPLTEYGKILEDETHYRDENVRVDITVDE